MADPARQSVRTAELRGLEIRLGALDGLIQEQEMYLAQLRLRRMRLQLDLSKTAKADA